MGQNPSAYSSDGRQIPNRVTHWAPGGAFARKSRPVCAVYRQEHAHSLPTRHDRGISGVKQGLRLWLVTEKHFVAPSRERVSSRQLASSARNGKNAEASPYRTRGTPSASRRQCN